MGASEVMAEWVCCLSRTTALMQCRLWRFYVNARLITLKLQKEIPADGIFFCNQIIKNYQIIIFPTTNFKLIGTYNAE